MHKVFANTENPTKQSGSDWECQLQFVLRSKLRNPFSSRLRSTSEENLELYTGAKIYLAPSIYTAQPGIHPSFHPSPSYISIIHPLHLIHPPPTYLSSTLYISSIHQLYIYHPPSTYLSSTLYIAIIHPLHIYHPPSTYLSSTLYIAIIHPQHIYHPPSTYLSSTLYISSIHLSINPLNTHPSTRPSSLHPIYLANLQSKSHPD